MKNTFKILIFTLITLSARLASARGWVDYRRPWNPRDVGTCAYWTEVSRSRITIATGIATIADMSGNGRDLAQATTTKQPALATGIFGSRSAALYDGATNTMQAGGATIGTTFTRFVVGKYASANPAGTLFDGAKTGGGGNNGRLYRVSDVSLHLNVGAESVATTTPQSAHVFMFVDAPGASASSFDVDGTNVGTMTASGQAAHNPVQGTFGDGASDPGNGYIGADIEFSAVLSATDVARVKFYLKAEYGTP